MKKIALVITYVSLNNEKGYTRFRFLAEFLAKNGFSVDLITSTFQHWEKKQRERENSDNKDYNIFYINEPGYKKNIDFRRIYSHKKLAHNLKDFLENRQYDLVYCSVPPNNIGLITAEYCQNKNIPLIIDVEDLWPEAMKMVFDIPVISKLAFRGFEKDIKQTYKLANAIVGTSDEYRDRPLKDNPSLDKRITVYVGNEIDHFDEGVRKYALDIAKNNEFWISYAGNLGTSYDIATLIKASSILKKDGIKDHQVIIMGGGPLEKEFKELAKNLDCNVRFLGYLPYEKMAAYLSKSDIVINSFVKKAPQSIVTKIGDYLASGKPMINTCMSEEFKKKVENDGFGINIEPEDELILAKTIEKLYTSKNLRDELGKKARKIAEIEFDRKISYKKIIYLIEDLLKEEK